MSRWWHGTSIYQVYPRSFADSDGDGIGDLRGIIGKLDYIQRLGVETVWISPFFSGPQRDFGYDITDYTGVAPEYGSVGDAEELIEQVHLRGMKIMFDLVLNHTSDEHPWFIESAGSRDNPKSDWYIWRDGRGKNGRKPPNNWRSTMEVRSAWQWNDTRKQWYLATFLPFQPDLNWRNPDVKAVMFDAIRFWLDRGVDGCRLDIFGSIMKDATFRNNPVSPTIDGAMTKVWRRDFTENTADNVTLAKDLRALCGEYGEPERILLGEVFGPADVLRRYLGEDDGLQLVFLFEFLAYRYSAQWFRETIREFEANFAAPMQPTYVLENHDRSRTIDRVGGDLNKARVLAVLLLTLRGVATIYNGQEIGMSNTPISLRDAKDPIAATFFKWVPDAVSARLPERINRDEMRTPMQWDGSPNAGFSPPGTQTWLPVNPNYSERNVRAQDGDPYSMLNLYRSLLTLRWDREELRDGSLRLVDSGEPDVVSYVRETQSGCLRVHANLGKSAVTIRERNASGNASRNASGNASGNGSGKILLATGTVIAQDGVLTLHSNSAAIIG